MRFILFLSIFFSFKALACSCNDISVKEALNTADLVVIATPNKIEKVEPEKGTLDMEVELTSFTVTETFKGTAPDDLKTKIMTICCVCGIAFEEGEKYLLYLTGPNEYGYYSTSICARSKNIEYAGEDLSVLKQQPE